MLDTAIISVVQPFLSQAGVFQPLGREILSRPDKCRLKHYSVCDKTTIFHGLPNWLLWMLPMSGFKGINTCFNRPISEPWIPLDNHSDLWHLRHWLQSWQLRTRIHDNLCYLTIKSDNEQHSQFLRYLFLCAIFEHLTSQQKSCKKNMTLKNTLLLHA